MATATSREQTSQPILKCWDMAKDLDDREKLELVQMLVGSLMPPVAKAREQEEEAYSLKPYTMDEINAMLDEAEANFAAGRGIPHEEVMRELEEEFAREDAEEDARRFASYAKEFQLAEAV